MTVDVSNLKRKVIRIIWEKKIFFQKKTNVYINSQLIKYGNMKWDKKKR